MKRDDLEQLEAQLLLIRQLVGSRARHIASSTVTLAQAARMLSCTPRHIRKLLARGTLRARDVMGDGPRIPVAQIHELLKR